MHVDHVFMHISNLYCTLIKIKVLFVLEFLRLDYSYVKKLFVCGFDFPNSLFSKTAFIHTIRPCVCLCSVYS